MIANTVFWVMTLSAGDSPTPPAVWLAATDARRHSRGRIVWRIDNPRDPAKSMAVHSQWTDHEYVERVDYVNTADAQMPSDVRRLWQYWEPGAHYSTSDPVLTAVVDERAAGEKIADFDAMAFRLPVQEKTQTTGWSVSSEGSLHHVIEHQIDSRGVNRDAHYWVDAERGNNITRSEIRYGAEVRARSEIDLALYGDVWAPSSITHYWNDLSTPMLVIGVENANYDASSLPERLTPESIGLQTGTAVIHMKADGTNENRATWDGERVAPWKEVGPRVHSGELQIAPDYQAALAARQLWMRENESAAAVAPPPSYEVGIRKLVQRTPKLWEQHVLDFIAKFRLTKEQQSAAWKVHSDCVDRAHQLIRKHAGSGRKSESQRPADAAAASGQSTAEAESRPSSDEKHLLASLDRIFEEDLEPRLRSLLTRKQAATSLPAKR